MNSQQSIGTDAIRQYVREQLPASAQFDEEHCTDELTARISALVSACESIVGIRGFIGFRPEEAEKVDLARDAAIKALCPFQSDVPIMC